MTDQEFLDKCAVEAMKGLLSSPNLRFISASVLAQQSYEIAKEMLKKRKP